ncbi:MAG: MBL fold metallo-hydrolase [Oligoflexia bacterium]|nr:MBL fold metallo-hydrolase [Oligoflexia bacterium]MBF0365576.1 MBL fold metallo-hydrolase [Oligoflexia bacterium]
MCMRTPLKIIAIIILLLLLIGLWFFYGGGKQKLFPFQWTVVNVAEGIQGDAHLLRFHDRYWLIDAGHESAAGTLIAYLKRKNIGVLDAVIITHAHTDHYGGLIPLLASGIRVNEVYINFPDEKKCLTEPWGCSLQEMNNVQAAIRDHGARQKSIVKGMKQEFAKDLRMEVIHVYGDNNSPLNHPLDINDMSALVMIYHGESRYFLTGDLNVRLGDWLTKNDRPGILADLLKVPHHGADSLPHNEFFQAVGAKDTIVTAPRLLWEGQLCLRIKQLLPNSYVSGVHGQIDIYSYKSGYLILCERGCLPKIRNKVSRDRL